MKIATVCCAALCGVLAGCQPSPLDEPWVERRPLHRELPAPRPDRDGQFDARRTTDDPTGPIRLRDALALTLERNPSLAAAALDVRVREAEAIQAGMAPNPELEAELENFGGTGELAGFGSSEATLQLGQLIELGGDRVGRARAGTEAVRLSGWDYELARIDALSGVSADFVRLLAAQRRVAYANETERLAERVFTAISERADAGKISPVERTKASVELALAKLDATRARLEVSTWRVRVASHWGSTSATFSNAEGDLETIPSTPELDSLFASVSQNPDVARWAAEAALRQAEVDIALAQRVPDLMVSGGVKYLSDIDEMGLVVGLSIPLPVFDRNQGSIQAVRLREIRSGHLSEAARTQIWTSIAEAHAGLEAASASVHAIRDEVIPSAQSAFDAASDAFSQGKIGALDLLDAERTLFEGRRQLIDALVSYHLAVIAIERLIGAPISTARDVTGGSQ